MKYATTTGSYRLPRFYGDEYVEGRADNPIPPDNSKWKLVAMTATEEMLFWSWELNDD